MMELRVFYFFTCFILVYCDDPSYKSLDLEGHQTFGFVSPIESFEESLERDDVFWQDDDLPLDQISVRRGNNSSGPTANTDCGTYQGRYGGGKGCKYEKFLGIRYAKPPIGTNRFQSADYLECDSSSYHDASQFCPPCMQPKGKALQSSRKLPSEDCLCMNVYRPLNCDEEDKKPVLVYIHESYYLYGSAAQPELNGGCLADKGDMIVVTFNYRLGAFGWIYSGDEDDIPGNQAYTDVITLLYFVRSNIQYFGGDPDKITVGGHGAGAVIACSLMFSYGLDENLFQGVMCMSPNWNVQSYYDSGLVTQQKSNLFLECINCGSGDKNEPFDQHEKECLRNSDSDEVARASDEIPYYDANGICSMSQLMLSYMLVSLDDRMQKYMYFKDKWVFIGTVDTEFKKSFKGTRAESVLEGAKIITENVKPVILRKKAQKIQNIVDFYLGHILKDDPFIIGEQTTMALNDLCYGCPTTEITEYLSAFSELYAYRYSYVASCYKDDPKRRYGAYHPDDVPFGFGEPFRIWSEFTDEDREASQILIDIWSDFVHHDKMKWPKYDDENQAVMQFEGFKGSNYWISNPNSDACEHLDA